MAMDQWLVNRLRRSKNRRSGFGKRRRAGQFGGTAYKSEERAFASEELWPKPEEQCTNRRSGSQNRRSCRHGARKCRRSRRSGFFGPRSSWQKPRSGWRKRRSGRGCGRSAVQTGSHGGRTGSDRKIAGIWGQKFPGQGAICLRDGFQNNFLLIPGSSWLTGEPSAAP